MAGYNLEVKITGLDDLKKPQAFCDVALMRKATSGGVSYATEAAITAASRLAREH
jgi:hypothetical protein